MKKAILPYTVRAEAASFAPASSGGCRAGHQPEREVEFKVTPRGVSEMLWVTMAPPLAVEVAACRKE